jgi:C-terminal processing protease CtpA/Prc
MYALSEYSECTRLAGVVIAWNVLQHFYPYFDVVDVDWDRQLTRALERTLADESGEDYFDTLREMAAALNDGQATIDHPRYRPSGYLPFEIDRVEGKIVVDSAGHSLVERGDVIEVVDGIDAGVALERVESLLSGSPQLKRTRALFLLGAGEAGSSIAMTVRRGEDLLDVEIRLEPPGGTAVKVGPEKIEEIEDGIFYVDLSRAAMPEISERMAELAIARGVIFDLRGYLHGNQELIGHLLSESDTSMDWMRVPQIIYPDHVGPAGWSETGWAMQPLEPRIGGKVAFITNATAISYAESFMGLVEGFGIGEIVGQPTAGTNGNVNPMMLPGGFSFPWTGTKVVKLDGSQHHLIGVRPTVSVKRTIQGVREGRDELLEKALEIVDSETTE